MRLYLMQHGKPLLEEVDPARPLSDQGSRDVMKDTSMKPHEREGAYDVRM